MKRKEDYADIESIFARKIYIQQDSKNPNPEYLKAENFDTLDGRVEIV